MSTCAYSIRHASAASHNFEAACRLSFQVRAFVTSQMWRLPHPPARGSRMLSTRPYVHAGFLRSWTAQGFSEGLTARVRDIVAAMPLKGRRARVYVTGADTM